MKIHVLSDGLLFDYLILILYSKFNKTKIIILKMCVFLIVVPTSLLVARGQNVNPPSVEYKVFYSADITSFSPF